MNLIIAGSRSITSYPLLRSAIIDSKLWHKHGKKIVVFSGKAKGVDTLGEEFADKAGLLVEPFPADWDDIKAPGAIVRMRQDGSGLLYNAGAGFTRNQQMADKAHALLLLWDGSSTGSQDMLKRALKKGLEIHGYKSNRQAQREGRVDRFI